MKYALIAVACLALAACGAPVSPAEVAALESGLTAADRAALAYTTLPACPIATPVCADAAVKAQIKAKEMTAYTAIKSMQASSAAGTPSSLALAQAALSAYLAVIPAPAK